MAGADRPRKTSWLRVGKWLLLIQLSGGCLLTASCGDQIRTAIIAGVFDFIGVATNQFVAGLFPVGALFVNLLTGR